MVLILHYLHGVGKPLRSVVSRERKIFSGIIAFDILIMGGTVEFIPPVITGIFIKIVELTVFIIITKPVIIRILLGLPIIMEIAVIVIIAII